MTLYQKLFGRYLKPLDDDGGEGGGAGHVDRGDDFAASETPAKTDEPVVDTSEDDLDVALGKDKGTEEQPRDKEGKFAKKEDKGEGTMIPKSRFDEQVRKEREARETAERRLAELEQQRQQVSRGVDIAKLEQDVRDLRAAERKALISGQDKEAAELADQADRLNRQIAIEQARDMSAAAKEQAREEIRWDMTLERIEADYPTLDEKSDSFDQELTDDVVDKMNGYMARERMPRSQALLKAVKYVMERRATPEPEPEKDEGKKGLDRGQKTEDRKEAAVRKNLDAASRQPASTKKVGADSDKHGQTAATPDADQMTYEEFSALPDTTKAKMRGDYV